MYKADLNQLDLILESVWNEILSQSKLVQAIFKGDICKALFVMYMLETYHYTKHNTKNQALVGVRNLTLPHRYTSYCFKHAREEIGHEDMALRDIANLDFVLPEIKNLKPLPATEVLIAYLYWISFQGNPIQRLGYSYWAESCYHYINPIIQKLSSVLKLKEDQLSFFIAHSSIDEKHFKEVADMILSFCYSEQDFQDITRVMETSLRLTGQMLDNVYHEYQKVLQGKSNLYPFLSKQSIPA